MQSKAIRVGIHQSHRALQILLCQNTDSDLARLEPSSHKRLYMPQPFPPEPSQWSCCYPSPSAQEVNWGGSNGRQDPSSTLCTSSYAGAKVSQKGLFVLRFVSGSGEPTNAVKLLSWPGLLKNSSTKSPAGWYWLRSYNVTMQAVAGVKPWLWRFKLGVKYLN